MDGNDDQHKSGERIAKVIARAGLASRREAEDWIAAGRVAVNGAVIRSPALNVTAGDQVSVDGAPLPGRERTRLFLYHKPRGLLTTHADPQGRPTIFARLPQSLPRLISVGRLDFNTEGLLLLTNDGALARVLELPATGWLRRYRVRAHGSVAQAELDGLRGGVTISGIHYGSIDASIERMQGSNLWLSFAIREGKNREVRNVLTHLGLTVTRLIRVSFGPFQLGELAEGAVEEVRTRTLREQLGDKLTALAGADFSSPPAPPREPRERDGMRDAAQPRPTGAWSKDRSRDRNTDRNTDRNKDRTTDRSKTRSKGRKSPDHAWRARQEERPGKKLQRGFHGLRHEEKEARDRPDAKPRAGQVTDRRGRAVTVERFGQPPVERPLRPEPPKHHRSRRRSPDRSSGPRPRSPRGRG